jgi:outer membrane beta-barrel protein
LVARKRILIGSLLGILLMGWMSVVAPAEGYAETGSYEDRERSYSSVVVQNRRHDPTHEFSALVGVLPLDAFTKGLTVGGAYTLHFTELLAWEVVQFNYSFKFDTELKADLAAFDVGPTPFEVLDYYASSNLVFKPVYWKGSLLNSGLVRGELYAVLGGAYGAFTRTNRGGADIGGGVRLFTSDHVSWRLDARYFLFFNDNIFDDFSTKDELAINFGASLSF